MQITSYQQLELQKFIVEKYQKRVVYHIETTIDKEFLQKRLIKRTLKEFVEENYIHSLTYGIVNEDSILAYIILSILNGDNFLETEQYALYKYKILQEYGDPNMFVFEIPSIKKDDQ